MWETPIHGRMPCRGGSTHSAKPQLIRFCFYVAKSGVFNSMQFLPRKVRCMFRGGWHLELELQLILQHFYFTRDTTKTFGTKCKRWRLYKSERTLQNNTEATRVDWSNREPHKVGRWVTSMGWQLWMLSAKKHGQSGKQKNHREQITS